VIAGILSIRALQFCGSGPTGREAIPMSTDSEGKITKALSDIETAKRRATMALKAAHEALRLSLSTPRIGAMLKEIEKELSES